MLKFYWLNYEKKLVFAFYCKIPILVFNHRESIFLTLLVLSLKSEEFCFLVSFTSYFSLFASTNLKSIFLADDVEP